MLAPDAGQREAPPEHRRVARRAGEHLIGLRSVDAFEALVRPYPTAVAGVPTSMTFDRATGTFAAMFSAPVPAPRERAARITVVEVPARLYPDGYRVRARGAWVE